MAGGGAHQKTRRLRENHRGARREIQHAEADNFGMKVYIIIIGAIRRAWGMFNKILEILEKLHEIVYLKGNKIKISLLKYVLLAL